MERNAKKEPAQELTNVRHILISPPAPHRNIIGQHHIPDLLLRNILRKRTGTTVLLLANGLCRANITVLRHNPFAASYKILTLPFFPSYFSGYVCPPAGKTVTSRRLRTRVLDKPRKKQEI